MEHGHYTSAMRRSDAWTSGRLTAVLALLLTFWASTAAAQSGRDLASPWTGDRGPSARSTAPTDTSATDILSTDIPPAPGAEVIPPPPSGAYVTPGAVPPPPTTGLRLPSTISTRLRALEGDLAALAQRGSGYIVDGIVQLLSSGVSIAVGVLFLTASSGGGTAEQMAAYLFSMSGVGVARGLLTLFLPVTPAESTASYLHPVPLTSYREARARLQARESELHGLSDAAMVGRVVDGSLGIASSLAIIPLLALYPFDSTNPYNYVMILLAGVSAVTGAITLFSTSDAERRWSGYTELRDRLAATASGDRDEQWLDEHADDEPISEPGPDDITLRASVGLLGGSLSLTF